MTPKTSHYFYYCTRGVKFLEKKVVTQRAITVFQPALCAHALACVTWLKAKQSLRKYLGFSKNETQTTVVLHAY